MDKYTPAENALSKIYLPDIVGGGYGKMWRSKARYIAIKGSRRSKKSKTQALKLIYQLLKHPLSNALVARRYYNTLHDSCFTELKWAINRFGVREYFDVKEHPLEMTYTPTGQKIYFRGLDDAMKITSITCEIGYLCFLWLEEAFEVEDEETFNKLNDSMMGALPDGYFRQTTLTFNPWSPSTWIKARFFDSSAPNVLTMTTTYRCNEWLSDEDKAEFEYMRLHQPHRFRVSGDGDWGVDGAVFFEEFRPDVHVITPFEIPEHWRVYRAIDYGLDMLAGIYVAEDTRGCAYVVGEVYKSGLIASEAAEALKAAEPRKQEYITFAPPDLWARTKDTGKTISEIYRDSGVTLTKAANGRAHGWMQVKERLKVFTGENGEPDAMIKIFSTCKNLIRCISTIKADEDDCNDCATEPHELTHINDALRYFCISRTRVPREPDARTEEEKQLARYKESKFQNRSGRKIIH